VEVIEVGFMNLLSTIMLSFCVNKHQNISNPMGSGDLL